MDNYQQDSYISPNIQINLIRKDEVSYLSPTIMLDPNIYVDFSLKNYVVVRHACVSSDNGWGLFTTDDEKPASIPTMELILDDDFVYKESIWIGLTFLGVQERFIKQVVKELEDKVEEVFASVHGCVGTPGIVNEYYVNVKVDIVQVSVAKDGFSEVDEGSPEVNESSDQVVEVDGGLDLSWAAEEWPIAWLE